MIMNASLTTRFQVTLATGFGIGHLMPIGQGTLAAAASLLFIGRFISLTPPWQLLIVIGGLCLGIQVSNVAEKFFGAKDDHRIVIDEIISVFISFLFLPALVTSPLWLVIGLMLNRVLDIAKPHPIHALQRLPGGWGVMMDDVVVGIYTNLILRAVLGPF